MFCIEIVNIYREMFLGSRRFRGCFKGVGGLGMELWELVVCLEEDGFF